MSNYDPLGDQTLNLGGVIVPPDGVPGAYDPESVYARFCERYFEPAAEGGGAGLVLAGVAAFNTSGDPSTIQDDRYGYNAIAGQGPIFGAGDETLPWNVVYLHSFGDSYGGGEVKVSTVIVEGDQGEPFTSCTVKLGGAEYGPFQMVPIGGGLYGTLHAGSLVVEEGQAIELSLSTEPFPEDGALAWTFTAGNAGTISGLLNDELAGGGPGSGIGAVTAGPAAKLPACYTGEDGGNTVLSLLIRTTAANPSDTLTMAVNGGAPVEIPFSLADGAIDVYIDPAPAGTAIADGDTVVLSLS
jgi:hypothetical protein